MFFKKKHANAFVGAFLNRGEAFTAELQEFKA